MSNFKPCQRPDTYLFYIFVFLGTCFKKGDVYLLCKFLSIVGGDNFSFWFVIFIADWNRGKSTTDYLHPKTYLTQQVIQKPIGSIFAVFIVPADLLEEHNFAYQ